MNKKKGIALGMFLIVIISGFVYAVTEPAPPSLQMSDSGGVEFIPGCSNGIQDGSETDIDCGGPDCPSCESAAANGSNMTMIIIIAAVVIILIIAIVILLKKKGQGSAPQAQTKPRQQAYQQRR
jgi:hypothetical protein